MKEQKKEFRFDRRAAANDEGVEGRFSRKFYRLLRKEVALPNGSVLLDVGCGTGALLRVLSKGRHIRCVGVDQEENRVAVARQNCPKMEFKVARCEDLPFPKGSFDAVVCCVAYYHFSDKEGFAREAARVLSPGGRLYIADPRFPELLHKGLNGLLGLIRMEAEFCSPEALFERFAAFGFEADGFATDGFAQVVRLMKREWAA